MEKTLERWIASARVLNEYGKSEDERLFSKVLSEVVETFRPLGVRIFNLSVNIINHLWNLKSARTAPRKSWLARAIDRLSREKDVIFVISTGNLLKEDVKHFIQDTEGYPAYFFNDEAKLLDPAQSALAVTVGSLAHSVLISGNVPNVQAIADKNFPSPFTRCGSGIMGEIKPEVMEYGGNLAFNQNLNTVVNNPSLDIMVASNRLSPALTHDSGTSFATPRISFKLAQILKSIEALENVQIRPVSAPLLRAFLINSSQYPDELQSFIETLKKQVSTKHWANITGYGVPEHDRATNSDEHSVVMFYQGSLPCNQVALFEIPVPVELSNSRRETKRLTITVSFAPEVQKWGLDNYLGTSLKWRLFRGDIDREEVIAALGKEDEENSQEKPELPDELSGQYGLQLRSRGTIQHDIFEWKQHKEHFSNNSYTLGIAGFEKWGRKEPPPVPFAVVARLEDCGQTTEIYSLVQNILTRIEISSRVNHNVDD
ncbi:MAG: S8 family peptidase [Candidatus Riflebacteria bacterium]|nr:S8 family peptidase [Candidatus Riflebacteria bacterium]